MMKGFNAKTRGRKGAKRLWHLPGQLLICLCGAIAGVMGWRTADKWLERQDENQE